MGCGGIGYMGCGGIGYMGCGGIGYLGWLRAHIIRGK